MNTQTKFKFASLRDDEQVLHIIHRNWFYIASQFFTVTIVLLIFFAAIFFLPYFYPLSLEDGKQQMVAFLGNIVLLSFWIYIFLLWIDFYFDVWVITDQRLINIEQNGLFSRKISELEYSKIQDITVSVMGFIPTVINYGDVLVQTAGELENFDFSKISDPYKIRDIIMELQHSREHQEASEIGEAIRKKIEED